MTHKIELPDKTLYIELFTKTATVVTETSQYTGIDFETNELRVAAYKSLCDNGNKCSKAVFDAAQEKAKKMLINN